MEPEFVRRNKYQILWLLVFPYVNSSFTDELQHLSAHFLEFHLILFQNLLKELLFS